MTTQSNQSTAAWADNLTANISRVLWAVGLRGDDYAGSVKTVRELILHAIQSAPPAGVIGKSVLGALEDASDSIDHTIGAVKYGNKVDVAFAKKTLDKIDAVLLDAATPPQCDQQPVAEGDLDAVAGILDGVESSAAREGKPFLWSPADTVRAISNSRPVAEGEEMRGLLVRAGTFPVRDEEVTGFVVACSREDLEKLKRLPLYHKVIITEALPPASDGEDKARLDWLDANVGYLELKVGREGTIRQHIDAARAANREGVKP
jgi:hypothetical protein